MNTTEFIRWGSLTLPSEILSEKKIDRCLPLIKRWLFEHCGVLGFHGTRIQSELSYKNNGILLPDESALQEKLIELLINDSIIDSIGADLIRSIPNDGSEVNSIFAVPNKDLLVGIGTDHYCSYGSEYWQKIVSILEGRGYSVNRNWLKSVGKSAIIHIEITWDLLDASEIKMFCESIFEAKEEGSLNYEFDSAFRIDVPVPSDKIRQIEYSGC